MQKESEILVIQNAYTYLTFFFSSLGRCRSVSQSPGIGWSHEREISSSLSEGGGGIRREPRSFRGRSWRHPTRRYNLHRKALRLRASLWGVWHTLPTLLYLVSFSETDLWSKFIISFILWPDVFVPFKITSFEELVNSSIIRKLSFPKWYLKPTLIKD